MIPLRTLPGTESAYTHLADTHPFSRRQFLRWAGLGTIALAAGACSVGSPRYSVIITSENTFSPSPLVIPQGASVVWLNNTAEAYTVTCDPAQFTDKSLVRLPLQATSWDSGNLYPGQRWLYTFTTQGFYLYTSRLGNPQAAKGIVVVTA